MGRGIEDAAAELVGGLIGGSRRRIQSDCIFTPEQIAEVVHEANRAYQRLIGDTVSPPWPEAPAQQKESIIAGVTKMGERFARSGDFNFEPEGLHNSWLDMKLLAGWTYGPTKDETKKTHPCCRSYDALPLEQKGKDYVFFGVVSGMLQQRRIAEEKKITG